MALWTFKRTRQAQEDTAERKAYVDFRQLLLYQQFASPYDAPIVKNLAYMKSIQAEQMPTVIQGPGVLTSGYGGVVVGQQILQPLQNAGVGTSSGGL